MPLGETRLEPLGPSPKYDPRLLGTWKSDRRVTFRHYRFKPSAKPAAVRRFKALFGKMVVRWDRLRCHIDLDGYQTSYPYQVVAVDDQCVIIRTAAGIIGQPEFCQLMFQGDDRYWLPVMNCPWMHECFRRVT